MSRKNLSQNRRDQGTLGAGEMVLDPAVQTLRALENAGRVHCNCLSRRFNLEPQAKRVQEGFWTERNGI